MAKNMFQSPKGALIFVGSTLLGAALLVGSEDQEGALVVATSELERQRQITEMQNDFGGPGASNPSASQTREAVQRQSAQEPLSFEFSSDEELIDDTRGFDPTPHDNGFGAYDQSFREPRIVDRHSEIIFK